MWIDGMNENDEISVNDDDGYSWITFFITD